MTSAYTYTEDGILACHIKLACGHTITATDQDGGMDEIPNVGRNTLTRAAQERALRHAIKGCTWTHSHHPQPRSTTPDTTTDAPQPTTPPARGRAALETEHGGVRVEDADVEYLRFVVDRYSKLLAGAFNIPGPIIQHRSVEKDIASRVKHERPPGAGCDCPCRLHPDA